jgi:glycosyltransferase involved in cell wall biosynthesis
MTRWLGHRSDVPTILAATDVVVFPSYYREGIPRVLLEAASMGCPIVAAAGTGSEEITLHDRNGLVVPARDPQLLSEAIQRLVRDAPLRNRLGEASRRLAVERFDINRIAEATIEIYERLLDARPD